MTPSDIKARPAPLITLRHWVYSPLTTQDHPDNLIEMSMNDIKPILKNNSEASDILGQRYPFHLLLHWLFCPPPPKETTLLKNDESGEVTLIIRDMSAKVGKEEQ